MKQSLKYISLLLAAIFVIAGTMMIAYAEGEEDEDPVDPVYSEPEPVYSEPEPVYSEPEPVYSEPEVDPEPVYSEPEVDYVTDPDTTYQTYEEDPIWYGDASSYEYNAYSDNSSVGSVSSQTNLYSTSGISAEEAAPNEWSEITLDEKTVTTGITDFSSIKANTETEDNGDWILYLGYLLIALAVLGILYFIIATAAQRKANKAAEARERRRNGSAPTRSTAGRMQAADAAQRTSRYADEGSYTRRVSSKADTGEVYVPRRARSTR